MKNTIIINIDWNNIATELPPLPVERAEGHRAPQEWETNQSETN